MPKPNVPTQRRHPPELRERAVGSVNLRVGNRDGTAESEILGGKSVEYPIGWLNGRLIVATGPAFIQNAGELNPYFARSYQLFVEDRSPAVRK